MRLLLVMEEVNCGGAELSFFALCRALASRTTVDLALYEGSLANSTIRALCESLRDTSVTVHRCRTRLNPGTFSNLHRNLRRPAARELADLIGTIRPDAVVVNLPTVERGQAVVDAADLVVPRPPVWGFLHLAQRPSTIGAKLGKLRDLMVPQLLRRFDGLLTVSTTGARAISARYRMRAPEVLYPPIPTVRPFPSTLDRKSRRAKVGLPDTFLLGIVGRVEIHHKGHDAALRVTRQLLEAGLPIHLVVVGDGPDSAVVRGLAERLQVASVASFLGWRQDAGDLIPLLSAVIMPSRYEGMPLVAMQAAAAGVPVVGYDVDGLAELLPPEFRVAAGDETALANTVAALVSGSLHWPTEELARRATAWSDPEKAADRLLMILQSRVPAQPRGEPPVSSLHN
jgi:glycosyltransferase involved in cell wall biosynthesis